MYRFSWGLMSYYSEIAIISDTTTRKLLKVECPKDTMTAFPCLHAFSHEVKLIQIIHMFRRILLLTFRYKLQPVLSFRGEISRKSISGVLGTCTLLPRGWMGEWRHSTRDMVVTQTVHDSNDTGMHIKRKIFQSAQSSFSLCMMHHIHCSLTIVLICHPSVFSPLSSFSMWGTTPWVIPPLFFPLPLNCFLHSTLCFPIFYCSATSPPPSAKRRLSCHLLLPSHNRGLDLNFVENPTVKLSV